MEFCINRWEVKRILDKLVQHNDYYKMTEEQKVMLKEQLTSMSYIAKYAKECNLYYRRLRNVIYEHDIKSCDIDFFKTLLEGKMISEIHKLFSKKKCDSRSFNKLKNQFKDTYKRKDLYGFLEKKYEDFRNTNISTKFKDEDLVLVEVNHAEIIDDIEKVRDKQLSHTEMDTVEMTNSLGDILICVEHCIEFAIETIKELHIMIFDEPIGFDFESSYCGITNFELLNAFIEKR